MVLSYLVITDIDRMPDIISSLFQIRCSLSDRMLVVAVVAGLVDEIDGSRRGMTQGDAVLTYRYLAISFYSQSHHYQFCIVQDRKEI